jgi:hypothetical protein
LRREENAEPAYAKSFGVASAERPNIQRPNPNAILQLHATQAMLSERRRGDALLAK